MVLSSLLRQRSAKISWNLLRSSSFPSPSLSSSSSSFFSSYSSDPTAAADAKDDDEFIFPLPLIMNSTIDFYWSGADITRHVNLFSNEFYPKKEIIYNKKEVKVIQVTHREKGVMTFTLLKDIQNKWKICNIFQFDKIHSQPEYSFSPTPKILSRLLQEISHQDLSKELSKDSNIFVSPYQYIKPPYSLKNVERISNFLKLPSSDFSLEYLNDSTARQQVLLRSSDQVLLETHLHVKNSIGITHSIIDLLLLIVNADTSEERIACVIVGGEQVRKPKGSSVE